MLNIYLKRHQGKRRWLRIPQISFMLENYFFTDEILVKTLTYTNASIQRFIDNNSDKINQQKDTHIKTLDKVKLKAFLGLISLCGSMRRNLSCVKDIFMHESASDIFQTLPLLMTVFGIR